MINVSNLFVWYCIGCAKHAALTAKSCCQLCSGAMEQRIGFCNNAKCRIPVEVDADGNCKLCGKPAEFRRLTDQLGYCMQASVPASPASIPNEPQPPSEEPCPILLTTPAVAATSA